MKTTIVIPTYNEAQSILPTLQALFDHVPDTVQVLVVDDQSPDGTADLVNRHYQNNQRVRVLSRSRPRSFGQSYLDGFKHALSDPSVEAIFEMDADLSHHPCYIHAMLQALQTHDVVIGSRYIPGGNVSNFSRHRLLMSKAANWYARALTRVPVADITAGFIGYKRSLLERIPFDKIMSDGYGFQIEMKHHAHKLGAQFKEIPIAFRDRYDGQSKMNKKMVWEGLKVGWRLR